MPDAPAVSVVMAVYNSAQSLGESIESILHQTFRDFEFLIIDDGSSDASSDILQEYSHLDERIRLYEQENRGLVASLNRGCSLARGRYIARMDADDVSLPDRFEKQFRFLEANPGIGVLGAWIQDIGPNGGLRTSWPVPSDPAIIRWFLMFGNCIAHPSVMMRRELVELLGGYRAEALHVEDYDLWIRATEAAGVANIPEILVYYRILEQSLSSQNLLLQESNSADLKCAAIGAFLRHAVDKRTVRVLQQSAEGSSVTDLEVCTAAAKLVLELYTAYVGKMKLSRAQAAEIAADALRRLWLLARFSGKVSIVFRSFQLVPAAVSLPNVGKIFGLCAWALKYRGRILMRERRQ